ncbi:MAG TPA: histidine kinase [Steroidobacteraceae bacterium]
MKRRSLKGKKAKGTVSVDMEVETSADLISLQSIARAKAEWECTVDAVPALICLLDTQRRVTRINRTVERWGLGPLRKVLGQNIHRVFHPKCSGRGCQLAGGLRGLWRHALLGGSATLQLEDSKLGKVLTMKLQSLPFPDHLRPAQSKRQMLFVASDVSELTRTQKDLETLNEQLEQRVAERTLEIERTNEELRAEIERRSEAEEALRASRNELSQLSVQLMRAQELERKRIAQELHDSVGQSLSAIKYTLEHTVQLADNPQLGDSSRTLAIAVGQVQRVIGEVRSISSNLRPPVLDDLGVASAVRGFCREWSDVYNNVTLNVRVLVSDADVPQRLGTSVFRAVQEALNNVAKHAKATQALVSLHRENDTLIVEVTDNGAGVQRQSALGPTKLGYGLRGLRERAAFHGGRMRLISRPGKGTMLRVVWPVQELDERRGAVA